MLNFESNAANSLIALLHSIDDLEVEACERTILFLQKAASLRNGLRECLLKHTLTEMQFGVLLLLVHSSPKPVAMKHLSQELAVSKPTVTDAVDKLEALGFAARVRDPSDRRSKSVALTKDGSGRAHTIVRDYLRKMPALAESLIDVDFRRSEKTPQAL